MVKVAMLIESERVVSSVNWHFAVSKTSEQCLASRSEQCLLLSIRLPYPSVPLTNEPYLTGGRMCDGTGTGTTAKFMNFDEHSARVTLCWWT